MMRLRPIGSGAVDADEDEDEDEDEDAARILPRLAMHS
jgi:hypothetical protein